MRRFFVDKMGEVGGLCTITGAEARHITKVLRMETGDRLMIMDGLGGRCQAQIRRADPKEVTVLLEKPLPPPRPSPLKMTLCQAVLKSHPMDYVIQKTSELGVAAIVPFTSERTVVRLAGDRLQNKLRHWQEIARHAATQSDRPSPAEIGPLTTFDDLLSRRGGENEMKLILWEQEGTKDLKTLLKAASPTGQVVGIVGPEGGFSREEVRRAQKAGFATASLGERVLRAETASVTLAAILQYEWGDLSLI